MREGRVPFRRAVILARARRRDHGHPWRSALAAFRATLSFHFGIRHSAWGRDLSDNLKDCLRLALPDRLERRPVQVSEQGKCPLLRMCAGVDHPCCAFARVFNFLLRTCAYTHICFNLRTCAGRLCSSFAQMLSFPFSCASAQHSRATAHLHSTLSLQCCAFAQYQSLFHTCALAPWRS